MSNNFSISIIYDEIEQQEGAKGIWNSANQIIRKIGIVDIKKLTENLNDFCQQIGKVFQGVTTSVEDYELQSFELSVDITAKGEVRFIGSLSSELKGGLKIVFTKQEPKK